MSLFAELKRRNVIRVGIAYVLVAWLVLQVADIVFDAIGSPPWVMQTLLVVLLMGLFLALFFAWVFELTPEGLKRESEVDRSQSITLHTGKKLNAAILALLALSVAYLLYDRFTAPTPVQAVSQPVASQGGAEAEDSDNARADHMSLAVLPFDNRSPKPEDAYFTDGIHDDLLTTLAKIGSLKVISRTSVLEYKNTTKKIPEIAAELGVANVLEGGVQRSGNQVRINVQLIDARTDEHLWAEIYDRELTAENLFGIQSEISRKIAEALQATLSPKEAEQINRMPTANLDAYDHYLRGKQLMATRRTGDLERATQEFQKAVELDPDFALAWVGVADSHGLLSGYSERDDDFQQVRQDAIDRALAIDPGMGEAYASLGMLHTDRFRAQWNLADQEKAEAAFRKAIELSPNYATAYFWYGNSLISDVLRTRERLGLAQKAIELDPRSSIISANLVNEYQRAGLVSQAEQQAKKLIEIDPDFANAHHELLDLYLWDKGDFAGALAQARKLTEIDPGNVDGWRHQVEVYAEIGDRASADAIQERINALNPDSFYGAYTELLFALDSDDAPAAREAIEWTLKRGGGRAPVLFRIAEYLLALGDVERASALYLQAEPDWLHPEAWKNLIPNDFSGGCLVAWVLLHSGKEDLGRQLLDKAMVFQEQQLPAAVEHPDRFNADVCYLAAGHQDKALEVMATQVADGQIFSWVRWHRMPVYDPIRLDPRYLSLLEQRKQLIETQRQAIEKMDAGAKS